MRWIRAGGRARHGEGNEPCLKLSLGKGDSKPTRVEMGGDDIKAKLVFSSFFDWE